MTSGPCVRSDAVGCWEVWAFGSLMHMHAPLLAAAEQHALAILPVRLYGHLSFEYETMSIHSRFSRSAFGTLPSCQELALQTSGREFCAFLTMYLCHARVLIACLDYGCMLLRHDGCLQA